MIFEGFFLLIKVNDCQSTSKIRVVFKRQTLGSLYATSCWNIKAKSISSVVSDKIPITWAKITWPPLLLNTNKITYIKIKRIIKLKALDPKA